NSVALVLEAPEYLAEVVGVREPPLRGDLLERRARGDQHPRRLPDPDLRHEAGGRHAGARPEEMREVAAAHAALGGERADAQRFAEIREHAGAKLVEQAVAIPVGIAEPLRHPLVGERELEQRQLDLETIAEVLAERPADQARGEAGQRALR